MLEALTYQDMLEDIAENMQRKGLKSDTIGILLTRPELDTGRHILDSLEYYHFRTGKVVNFYLPGYGAYWYNAYPDGRVVTKIDNVEWSFSNKMFVKFEDELELHSNWKYSGETELLFLEYTKDQLLFKNVLLFKLDNMLRDKAILSVDTFFNDLYRICKEKQDINAISDALGARQMKHIALKGIVDWLPEKLSSMFKEERHFCVRNMEKK